MREELLRLTDLGYSTSEIEEFGNRWAEGVIDFLCENIRYLSESIDKELLLKYAVFYCDSFAMNPVVFSRYLERLKKTTDEWCEIIEEQFWGYEGYNNVVPLREVNRFLYEPFLEIISSEDESGIQQSLNSIVNLAQRQYKFIIMLNKEDNFEISTSDIDEYWLQDLEVEKHELVRNVKFLTQKGVKNEAIYQFFWVCPLILTENQLWLEKFLVQNFGEDYVECINTFFENDNVDEFNLKITNY